MSDSLLLSERERDSSQVHTVNTVHGWVGMLHAWAGVCGGARMGTGTWDKGIKVINSFNHYCIIPTIIIQTEHTYKPFISFLFLLLLLLLLLLLQILLSSPLLLLLSPLLLLFFLNQRMYLSTLITHN